MRIEHVAIVGAGTIGRQFAGFFASEGIPVSLYDVDTQTSDEAIIAAKKAVKFRLREKLSTKAKAARGLKALRSAADLTKALNGADYVQECVYEDMELKRSVLSKVEENVSSEAIIATSSGGIAPSQLETSLKRPQRFLVVHPLIPINPTRLLELVPSPSTDPDVLGTVKKFFEAHGRLPITLNKEIDGYVHNRLYYIMWREMLNLIAQDVISPTELDRFICNWYVQFGGGIGPMLRTVLHGGSRETGGIDAALEYYNKTLPHIWKSAATWPTIPDDVIAKVAQAVKTMKAVKENKTEEIIRYREGKFASIYRMFKARDLDRFYV